MQSTLPKPDKTCCAQCGKNQMLNQAHRRCSKCRTVPYCSVECQRLAWKEHKRVCVVYAAQNSMGCTSVYIDEKTPKPKKGEIKRTRGDILSDLRLYALSHNGDTLTFSSWYLLELTKDITKAQTHFLAVTLHRTTSSNPRTLYSLLDAEVLPLSALEDTYANRAHFTDSSPVSPRSMLAMDEQQRKTRDGALGSVMVLSIELPKGDNRPPHKALSEVSIHVFQPLGLFKEHRDTILRMEKLLPPALPKDYHMRCLKNSLDGGAYSIIFEPYKDASS